MKLKLATVYKHSAGSASVWIYYIFMGGKHMISYNKDFTHSDRTSRLNWKLVYPNLYEEYHPNSDEQKLIILALFNGL